MIGRAGEGWVRSGAHGGASIGQGGTAGMLRDRSGPAARLRGPWL